MIYVRTPHRIHALFSALSVCVAMAIASCDRSGSSSTTLPGAVSARQSDATSRVYRSPLAGRWYPADKKELTSEIDSHLSKAESERLNDVCAVVLPHAGYRWSGPTAAYALKQLQNQTYQRVLVIGPTHQVHMQNVASVPEFTHYATPLGEVPLDQEFIAQLRKHSEFQNIPAAHEGEHSVQIELPLLQHVLGDFRFVPIVVGQLDLPTQRRIGLILGGLIDSKTLVVASSDFTHYGANFRYVPFKDDVPERLKKLDGDALDLLCKKDLDGWCDYIRKTEATICGRDAIGVLLSMLPDDSEVHRLHYDTSGRMVGDFSSSVSYCALAVSGKWPKPQRVVPDKESAELTAADGQRLLELARVTVTFALRHAEMPSVDQLDIEVTLAMEQVCGAFVTLVKDGELRGCIGQVIPQLPLYKTVMGQAVNAGLNDRRFPPVDSSELEQIDFEVSVLTPPRAVPSASSIIIGTHGIILEESGRSALFLPQVATEQGWDLETTLTHLSQKAGLPPDAWRRGASFEVFEAVVFREKRTTPNTQHPTSNIQ